MLLALWDPEHVWARERSAVQWGETVHVCESTLGHLFRQRHSSHPRRCHTRTAWSIIRRRIKRSVGLHKRKRGKAARGSNYCPSLVCNLTQRIQDDMHVFGYMTRRRKKSDGKFFRSPCLTSIPCQRWGWLVKLLPRWQRVWKMQEALPENVSGRAFAVHAERQITSEEMQWFPQTPQPSSINSVFIEAKIKYWWSGQCIKPTHNMNRKPTKKTFSLSCRSAVW